MRTSTKLLVLISLAVAAVAASSTGCSDSGSTSSDGGSTSSTSAASTSNASSSASTSSASTTSSGATTTSSSSSSSSGAGGGNAGEHLLVSELAVGPDAAEFVEIWNPTSAPVALDDYYLSDNSTYVDLASGQPWMPTTGNPGTDFLARFPAGTTIAPDAVIVVGFDADYETQFGACPDFFMGTAPLPCAGNANMVPAMLETEPGSITDSSGLSNAREMVMLFTWDGDTTHTLKDVDYLAWGMAMDPGTRVDKTGVAGYQPDTAPASQKPATAPVPGQSIERCSIEAGEILSGGNGITGHDETSEDMGSAFVVQATPTPGVKNACL
jgi:hypothetical protein